MKFQNRNYILLISTLILILFLSSCARCPKTCDDGNGCTTDYCSKETGYLCQNVEKEGCHCGNTVCEEELEENKCTCPRDCGSCKGKVNEYVNYACVDDVCITALKEDVEPLPQTLVQEIKQSGLRINVKIAYSNPHNIKTENVGFEFRLDDFNADQLSNLNIDRIIIKDLKSILINDFEVDEKLSSIGSSFSSDVPVNNLVVKEKDFGKELQYLAEVHYSYTKKSGSKTQEVRTSSKLKFGPFLPLEADR